MVEQVKLVAVMGGAFPSSGDYSEFNFDCGRVGDCLVTAWRTSHDCSYSVAWETHWSATAAPRSTRL